MRVPVLRDVTLLSPGWSRAIRRNGVGKKQNRQTLFERLKFNEDMQGYECEYSLGDELIGVLLSVEEGCESDALQELADKSEAILREWSTLQEPILKAARKELVSAHRLERGDESKVTLASLVPFGFNAVCAPDRKYFSFSIDIPDILSEDEHFDYASNFDLKSESTEIVHLM